MACLEDPLRSFNSSIACITISEYLGWLAEPLERVEALEATLVVAACLGDDCFLAEPAAPFWPLVPCFPGDFFGVEALLATAASLIFL